MGEGLMDKSLSMIEQRFEVYGKNGS